MSANEPVVHFGLGTHRIVDELKIEWPSRQVQTFANVQADHEYLVTEPVAQRSVPPPAQPGPRFRSVELPAAMVHREAPFDDFQREPLLPWKLSRLGPGLAVADVDSDGLEDVYLGGAAGQPGTLWLNRDFGRFQPVRTTAFLEDKTAEDMAALFLDTDNDGDLDLFVVSGGVECPADDLVLRDRLYLNDGRGVFSRAPANALPDLRDSGSCAAAADFDHDGDLDLFAGSRCVPGKYGQVPASRLLRNDSGTFEDVTGLIAPGLKNAG